MAKASSRKQTKRGAKASRSAFRAKPKPKPKPKPAKRRSKAPSLSPLGDLVLGEIFVPSGELGIFDIGLVGYLPRPALEPAIVKVPVPRDRALSVVGAVVANEDRSVIHRVSFVRVRFKFSDRSRGEHRPIRRTFARTPLVASGLAT